MSDALNTSAEVALERLKKGNEIYLNSHVSSGNISKELRLFTHKNGQSPYAIIVTCSDSRVIPESIFSAGIGELFVIRVAGNVIDNYQLGSIEYAHEHLGCGLVLVMGHTCCGAVGAAISGGAGGFTGYITDEIKRAIGDEKDNYKAGCLNVRRSIQRITLGLRTGEKGSLCVKGAMYHTDSGLVEFIQAITY